MARHRIAHHLRHRSSGSLQTPSRSAAPIKLFRRYHQTAISFQASYHFNCGWQAAADGDFQQILITCFKSRIVSPGRRGILTSFVCRFQRGLSIPGEQVHWAGKATPEPAGATGCNFSRQPQNTHTAQADPNSNLIATAGSEHPSEHDQAPLIVFTWDPIPH